MAARLVPDPPVLVAGPSVNPVSAGLPAGSVTDETEQALVIAWLPVAGHGAVDPHRMAEALLAWERQMVAAVGVAVPPEPLERFVDSVVATGRPTHDTGLAPAGAVAVAAAVSWGVAGDDFRGVLPRAVEAARAASRRSHHVAGADVARRIV